MLSRNTWRRVPHSRWLWNLSPLEMRKVSNNQPNDIVLSWCFLKISLFPARGTRFSAPQRILRCTELGAICSSAQSVSSLSFLLGLMQSSHWWFPLAMMQFNTSRSKMQTLMFLIVMLLYREMSLYNTSAVLKEALEYTSPIFPSAWVSKFKQLYFTATVVPFQQCWVFQQLFHMCYQGNKKDIASLLILSCVYLVVNTCVYLLWVSS